MEQMRVRFAPSPTGPFHIGGARSALFNWLLARKLGGIFVLRVEDTDLERSSKESEDNIKEALRWLGMDWDEGVDIGGDYGPYRQTERLAIYQKYTEQLLASGQAYYCYCTDEELEAQRQGLIAKSQMPRYLSNCRDLTEAQRASYIKEGRKPTVRFRVPENKQIIVEDFVRGNVAFDSNGIGDYVIVKSDGIPTYNYAVAIDDALMNITHVIRAEEHLSNTPRQILIYEALGFTIPKFGHISLILGKDRSKMSKRHGATSVDQYRKQGYLPAGLNNFLALLGWSPSGEEEIFSLEELVKEFNTENLAKNPAVFDVDKLNWINQHYMRQLSDEELLKMAIPHLIDANMITEDAVAGHYEWLTKVVATAKEHISYAAQIPEYVNLYFHDEFEFENDEAKNILCEETVPTVINLFTEKLQAIEVVDEAAVQLALKSTLKESKLGGKKVYMPIRVALTGNMHGPELTQIIPLLGVQRTLARIEKSMSKLK